MSVMALENRLRIVTVLVVVIFLTLLVGATALTQIQPTIHRDFPDPAVLMSSGDYYAYSTGSGYQNQFWHVPVQRSVDLAGGWRTLGDAMPALPDWIVRDAHGDGNVSAPEVGEFGSGYVLYFVARSASQNAECIGTAVGDSPSGPFRPTQMPLICQPNFVDSIDPQVFTDDGGNRYLLYASGQHQTTIWLQQVTRDGLGVVGERRALISADRPDESNIVEAPSLIRHGAQFVLFYSGNAYNSGKYFINYATAPTLIGPYVKAPGQFVNQATLGGRYPNPGGQTVIGDTPAELLFHATTGPGARSMFVAGLSWDPSGRPVVDVNNGLTHRYNGLAGLF
jgi:beta-xylosidase